MDDIVAVSAAREHLSELIDDVRTMGRRIGLTRHGRTVAVLVPVEDAEAIAVAEDELDKSAAIGALKDYMTDPAVHTAEEVFGRRIEGRLAGFAPTARTQITAMPGMTVGTLMELAKEIADGKSEGERRVADDIYSIRADGCRLVYAIIEGKRLVLTVSG